MTYFILALQLHCGIQQIGEKILSYGTVVYTDATSSGPQLAYFEESSSSYQEHSFCQKIRENMNSSTRFVIHLNHDGKQILSLDNLPK